MSADAVTDPLEELNHENEVTERLLLRLVEFSERLRSSDDVPADEIAEGLHLLTLYRALHAQRFDGDLQPEARPVAMPGCFPHLDEVAREHEELPHRHEEVARRLKEYADGLDGSRERLAAAIESAMSKDHDGVVYEGDYPLTCLLSALPDEAAVRLAEKFSKTGPAVADLEQHINRFLSVPAGERGTPLTVHCAESGCGATAQGRVAPGPRGELALVAPPGGWGIDADRAETSVDGTTRVHVGLRCPEHRARAPSTVAEVKAIRPGPNAATAPPASGVRDCCA